MRLVLHTSVGVADPTAVLAAFTEPLFRALAPPFPRLRVVRFDGSAPGDTVAIELDWLLFRQAWTSRITDAGATATEAFFVDEGQRLPWPLRAWHHRHGFRSRPDGRPGTVITDDITFRTGLRALDAVFYLILWGQMAYRRPIYRRWFGAPLQ